MCVGDWSGISKIIVVLFGLGYWLWMCVVG